MTTPLTLLWVSDETGTYSVTVDAVEVTSGSCTAGVPVVNVIDETNFFVGDNPVKVTVVNLSGVGFDVVNVTRLSGPQPPPTGSCWAAPLDDILPREEVGADPLANRLNRHFRQPLVGRNVFVLTDGRVVEDPWIPTDTIKTALWGASSDQHVSAEDALVLVAAGYGANLVACPQTTAGWDTAGWDTTPWDT